jgi:transcriptional regulator with XRE-family HTH domain
MEKEKQQALEAAGWRFGDADDFLGMTDAEQQMLDARVEAALAVRRQRERQNLSQKELAARLKTSQPRVAKIERAAADVTLDQILRAFAAAGGRVSVKLGDSGALPRSRRRARPGKAETTANSPGAEFHIELSETGS